MKTSVIGLCADVYILRTLCNVTGGQYHIVLEDSHFQELLLNYIKPRSVSKDCEATCVKMGFPHHSEKLPSFTACMWFVIYLFIYLFNFLIVEFIAVF